MGVGAAFGEQLRLAQAGDEEAFAALWREFQPQIRRYLWVLAPEAADDLSAETWLQVIKALRRFSGDERGFRAWLFTIARNCHLDWRRRSARRAETLVPSPSTEQVAPDDPVRSVETQLATEQALDLIAALPKSQAEAVMLRVVNGLDVATVARITGREPGTVRVLVHRGLKRLATVVEDARAVAPSHSEAS